MGTADGITTWLAGFDGTAPTISAMPEDDGAKGVQVNQSTATLKRYINGKDLKRLSLTLQYVAPWSGYTDGVNAEAMDYGERWLAWCSAQWPDNPPAIGDVQNMEAVYSLPTVAAVYQDEALARYQFGFAIDYIN